jgi:hypothetical protein
VTFTASTGVTYWIRVAGYNGNTGVFNLSLSAPSVPNDTCAGAVFLPPGTTGSPATYVFNNGCASDTAGIPVSGCGPFATDVFKDMWFTVGTPVASTIDLDTFGSAFDTVVAVYGGCPGAGELPIICNDDSAGVLQSHVIFSASAGATYYVRVGSYNAAGNGNGRIHLSATDVIVVPTCVADVNADGVVDGGDFTAFINSFSAGDVSVDPIADVNLDGTIDGSDFIEFINAFGAGC